MLRNTMSSISAQGVVERASAELSKRINGLGLRGSKHHRGGDGGKTSVMERVTNVFCGGGASISAPEKPSRYIYYNIYTISTFSMNE